MEGSEVESTQYYFNEQKNYSKYILISTFLSAFKMENNIIMHYYIIILFYYR